MSSVIFRSATLSAVLITIGTTAAPAKRPISPQTRSSAAMSRTAYLGISPAPFGGLSGSYDVLYSFKHSPDGNYPQSTLIADKSGSLYGTTTSGGKGGGGGIFGTVFKLTRTTTGYSESILYRFTGGMDGHSPAAGLIADRTGALYGTTSLGGGCSLSGCGTVFKLTPTATGYTESILHRFAGGRDGMSPEAGLIADASGALYGTTAEGGTRVCAGSPHVCGTVFKLTPTANGYRESILYNFGATSTDAWGPWAGLLADGTGALYGTAIHGGGGNSSNCSNWHGCGTVFKLTPTATGYSESVLHGFGANSTDGTWPSSTLIADRTGALYGTTSIGGTIGGGTVFKLTPTRSGYAERVLYNFKFTPDGYGPAAGLVADKTGALYGTTANGGYGGGNFCATYLGCGTVFKLVPTAGGYSEKVLYRFAGPPHDGALPMAGVLLDSTGAIYGTTTAGGPVDGGTVFRVK